MAERVTSFWEKPNAILQNRTEINHKLGTLDTHLKQAQMAIELPEAPEDRKDIWGTEEFLQGTWENGASYDLPPALFPGTSGMEQYLPDDTLPWRVSVAQAFPLPEGANARLSFKDHEGKYHRMARLDEVYKLRYDTISWILSEWQTRKNVDDDIRDTLDKNAITKDTQVVQTLKTHKLMGADGTYQHTYNNKSIYDAFNDAVSALNYHGLTVNGQSTSLLVTGNGVSSGETLSAALNTLGSRVSTNATNFANHLSNSNVHEISDIDGLQSALNGHNTRISTLETWCTSHINSSSTNSHTISQIFGLSDILEGLRDDIDDLVSCGCEGGEEGGGGGNPGGGGDVDLSGYLPLSGGTMMGDIRFGNDVIRFLNTGAIYAQTISGNTRVLCIETDLNLFINNAAIVGAPNGDTSTLIKGDGVYVHTNTGSSPSTILVSPWDIIFANNRMDGMYDVTPTKMFCLTLGNNGDRLHVKKGLWNNWTNASWNPAGYFE